MNLTSRKFRNETAAIGALSLFVIAFALPLMPCCPMLASSEMPEQMISMDCCAASHCEMASNEERSNLAPVATMPSHSGTASLIPLSAQSQPELVSALTALPVAHTGALSPEQALPPYHPPLTLLHSQFLI